MTDAGPEFHQIGTIQPSAGLIGFDADGEVPRLVSANIGAFLPGQTPDRVLDAPDLQALGAELTQALRKARARPLHPLRAEMLGRVGASEAQVIAAGRLVLMELLPPSATPDGMAFLRDVERMADRIGGAQTLETLFSELNGLLRILSGYERLQVLRLGKGGEARVVSETRAVGLSDRTGRLVDAPLAFCTTPAPGFRWIQDRRAHPVPLLARDRRTVDLTCLPSARPEGADLARLASLGVAADFCASLHVDGEIWGGFLFQNTEPWAPSLRLRMSLRVLSPLVEAHLARISAAG
ncbi:MAG: hypothetical protein OIF48_01960 [Silicimonas sp.]|nr:hypothetical protein [Silicimonas sp.]